MASQLQNQLSDLIDGLRGDSPSTSPPTTMFTYEQSNPLYWPGALTKGRWSQILQKAASGDSLAISAVKEMKTTGVFDRMARKYPETVPSSSQSGIGSSPQQFTIANQDATALLAWPIDLLFNLFSSDKADDSSKKAAGQAVDEAVAKQILSGPKFNNAVYLTFGYRADLGWKYGNVGNGVPAVRAAVVKRVRAGEPKTIAFYRAALKAGYNPPKSDPGLAQLS